MTSGDRHGGTNDCHLHMILSEYVLLYVADSFHFSIFNLPLLIPSFSHLKTNLLEFRKFVLLATTAYLTFQTIELVWKKNDS